MTIKIPRCCTAHSNAANRPFRRAADRTCVCRGECGNHPDPVDRDLVELFRWLLYIRTANPGGLVMVLRDQQRAEYTSRALLGLADRWGMLARRRGHLLHLADRQVAVITPDRVGQWLRGVDVVGAFIGDDIPPAQHAEPLLILATRLRVPGAQVFPERHRPTVTEHAWLLGLVASFGQCTCGSTWCSFDGLTNPCLLCAGLDSPRRCPVRNNPSAYPSWVFSAVAGGR